MLYQRLSLKSGYKQTFWKHFPPRQQTLCYTACCRDQDYKDSLKKKLKIITFPALVQNSINDKA